MYHHPVDNQDKEQRRKAAAPKPRRHFGLREVLFVLIAFALLALLPTSAQFGKDAPVELKDGLGSMERPEENFAGSVFYFLDPSDTGAAPQQSALPARGRRRGSGSGPSNGSIPTIGPRP